MKKLILHEMMILSHQEKKAKRIKFDKRRTIILGANGTGKSCLIKSIYKTFGAEPVKDHPTWKALNPMLFIRFSVDKVRYSILRKGNTFALFDSKHELIQAFDSVSKELAPYFSDLFDFQIQLPNHQHVMSVLPPAFLFLPYYIDQDISWQNNWSSFDRLTHFPKFREPIVSYHSGLKPNEYYLMQGEIAEYKAKIKELEDERKVLKGVIEKIKEKISDAEFNINIDDFKAEIQELLEECEQLKIQQERLKSSLVKLYNQKIVLETQLTIAKKSLQETRKDYKYATEILVDDAVDCPTCGAHYENTFVERFEIAKDEDRCKELIFDMELELSEITKRIASENDQYNQKNEEVLRITEILERKKGEVALKDVIENAGRNQVKSVFEENTRELMTRIVENASKQKVLEDQLKALQNKERRAEIIGYYSQKLRSNVKALDVTTLKEDDFQKIGSKINETGSALPRALMAYYFSFFEVMKKYTTSTFCPIVIDSPNQQAQDQGHIAEILNFIDNNQPDGSQMILGLEELYDVDFDCEVIELKTKGSLLQKSDYDKVLEILDPFEVKMWNSSGSNPLFVRN